MGLGAVLGSFAIFLVLLAHAGASVLLLRGDDPWSELDLSSFVPRTRRQTNNTEEHQDPATRCVIKNLRDIERKLEKALPPEKNVSKAAALAKPHQLFSNADTLTLEKFCAIYKASRSRLAGCGESQMKTFAAKALAVVDFICVDHFDDFVRAFPCIQKVDGILDAECQKNCSAYEKAAEILNNAGASVVKIYSPGEIKELFAQSCLYVSCFMGCQKPMLEAKCGSKVLELEMRSIAVTFRNLDDMMSGSSASNVWPRECKPLNSMGQHSEKENAVSKTPTSANNATSNDSATSTSSVSQGPVIPHSQAPAAPPNSTSTAVIRTSAKPTSPPVARSSSTSSPTTAKPLPSSAGNTTARAQHTVPT